jgi:hypothetical protein
MTVIIGVAKLIIAIGTSKALFHVMKRRKAAIESGIGDKTCTVREFIEHLQGIEEE